MKYFKKFVLLGIFALCGVSFCSAGNITLTGHVNFDNNLFSGNFSSSYLGSQPYFKEIGEIQNGGKFNNVNVNCNFTNVSISQYLTNIISTKSTNLQILMYYANNKGLYWAGNTNISYTYNDILNGQYNTIVSLGGSTYTYNKLYGYFNILVSSTGVGVDCVNNTCYIDYDFSCVLSGDNIGNIQNSSCPSCPSCPDQYSSLQCQTEYNLIPIEDVTKNYCEVNFDLIDPLDCPSSPSGSGDVSRSALYIDNVQYSGAPNIYININDLLEYSMTYVSGSAVVDVNGYSYDTGYMADILTIQEYHPTTEDFTTSFVSFLTFALPYVVVILFVVFVRKLIRKIFKF